MGSTLIVCAVLTCVLGIIYATCDGAARDEKSASCHFGNNTRKDSCTEILKQAFDNSRCIADNPNYRRCHDTTKYWKLNVTIVNTTCQNVSITYAFICVPGKDVAEFKAKKELFDMQSLSITASNSSSEVKSCERTTPADPECIAMFTESSSHGRISKVKINFLQNQFSSAAITTLSNHEARTMGNSRVNSGDIYRFGDRAPAVIAVAEGNDSSRTAVMIQIEQTYPLDYIENTIRVQRVTPLCSFYNTNLSAWDSSVCTTLKISDTITECSCHHNSAFAVVFALTPIPLDSTLKTVSMVFEIVSVMALAATFLLLVFYRKKMRDFDRVLVQISLCVSLAMAHTSMLLAGEAISSKAFCQAVIVLSHYFMVTSAVLMVMEGGIMVVKVIFPNYGGSSHNRRRRILGFVVAWILPIVYVGICAVIGIKNECYGNFIPELNRFEVCWITDSFNLVVIIPVAVALVINILIIVRLGLLVANLSRRAEEFKPTCERVNNSITHAGKAFRAVIILLPILGIPWLLGFFVNTKYPANTVFASIHIIVNGCQGICIFTHYVIFNSDMKASIRRSWESAKSEIASLGPNVHFVSNNSIQ